MKNTSFKFRLNFIDLILREWLVFLSLISLILTSIFTKQIPNYSQEEVEVLFLLFSLFISVNGLNQTGFLKKIAAHIEKGKMLEFKVFFFTFVLSMFVTNDIALIITVPITLSLSIKKKELLVILEALSANAGSALTPFGNPQNLFIYWHYKINTPLFIKTIAPFSLFFFIVLGLISMCIKSEKHLYSSKASHKLEPKAYFYLIFFLLLILSVLRILPIYVSIPLILFSLIWDKKALNIDYFLLVTFFCFFGIAENMKIILAHQIIHPQNVFLLSSVISQFISNVPTAILISKFTQNWKALLWGTNVGGFGSLFGSLANLIAYKFYVNAKESKNITVFTLKFLLWEYIMFFLSIVLYFLIQNSKTKLLSELL